MGFIFQLSFHFNEFWVLFFPISFECRLHSYVIVFLQYFLLLNIDIFCLNAPFSFQSTIQFNEFWVSFFFSFCLLFLSQLFFVSLFSFSFILMIDEFNFIGHPFSYLRFEFHFSLLGLDVFLNPLFLFFNIFCF